MKSKTRYFYIFMVLVMSAMFLVSASNSHAAGCKVVTIVVDGIIKTITVCS